GGRRRGRRRSGGRSRRRGRRRGGGGRGDGGRGGGRRRGGGGHGDSRTHGRGLRDGDGHLRFRGHGDGGRVPTRWGVRRRRGRWYRACQDSTHQGGYPPRLGVVHDSILGSFRFRHNPCRCEFSQVADVVAWPPALFGSPLLLPVLLVWLVWR